MPLYRQCGHGPFIMLRTLAYNVKQWEMRTLQLSLQNEKNAEDLDRSKINIFFLSKSDMLMHKCYLFISLEQNQI